MIHIHTVKTAPLSMSRLVLTMVASVAVVCACSSSSHTETGVVSAVAPHLCLAGRAASGHCYDLKSGMSAGLKAGQCIRIVYAPPGSGSSEITGVVQSFARASSCP